MCRQSRFALGMAFTVLSAFRITAGEQEGTWQIGWTIHDIGGHFAPFRATTPVARMRLAVANAGDPAVVHWLEMIDPVRTRPVSYPIDFGEPASEHGVYLPGLYQASVALFAEANLADAMSSYGRRELNPVLAGSGGRFDSSSIVRKAALAGGLIALQISVLHRHPRHLRAAAIGNYIAAAVLAGIVAHNYLLPADARAARPQPSAP